MIDTERHTMHCEWDDVERDDRAASHEALRARIRQKLDANARSKLAQTTSSTYTPPRYDEVFFDGLAWLDSL